MISKPDFQKAHEESDNMIRLCEHARFINDVDGTPLARIMRNQQAILRCLDIVLGYIERQAND